MSNGYILKMQCTRLLAALLLPLLITSCSTTKDAAPAKLVNYLELIKIYSWQVEPKKRTCKHLYRYEDQLVIQTGKYWGVYNPKNGLFATGYGQVSVHTFEQEEGLCALEYKLPEKIRGSHQVYIQDPSKESQIKIRDAMDAIANYGGTNINADLKTDLALIGRTFEDYSIYQSRRATGEVVEKLNASRYTLENLASHLKRKVWQKGETFARKQKSAADSKAFWDHQYAFIDSLNKTGREVWENRVVDNQQLSRGDKICDYGNYFGFIEDISNTNVKIMWKGKAQGHDDGIWFGNMPVTYADKKTRDRVYFNSTNVNDLTWVSKHSIAKCTIEFN